MGMHGVFYSGFMHEYITVLRGRFATFYHMAPRLIQRRGADATMRTKWAGYTVGQEGTNRKGIGDPDVIYGGHVTYSG
ncbi:hypothetical protein GCM10027018_25520 [Paenibacillus thermoaerophilus]